MTEAGKNAYHSDEELIKTEVRGNIMLIGLNRPKERNAFTTGMLFQLCEAYTKMEEDPNVRCGLVYAEGKHFTLGLDLPDVTAFMQKERRFPLPPGAVNPFAVTPGDRVRTKPVVVAVHGFCFTIGIELMLASDIRLAAPSTRFGQIEVQRGIMPFGGATMRWVEMCGWGNAQRYLLTGDELGGEEAFRIGLVQELVEKKSLMERSIQMAENVAAQAPLAVQASLASSRKSVLEGETAAAKDLMSVSFDLMDTADAQEGRDSFTEKRKAVFTGK